MTLLVKGISSKKPIKSVKKPGTISSKAAIAIEAPDNISKAGILFWYRLTIPDLRVCIPCIFAKYTPITAVKKIRLIVLRAPILLPIFIIRKISNAGSPIKSKKNEFICQIQKYMINV